MTDTKSKKRKSLESSTEQLCINTIRVLAADIVQKSDSGHPGMPMGMAPVAHVLWSKILRFAPHNPKWFGRDRFVLSNGHGCALLYIMLHLTGYKVEMDDLKKFRQLNSITPGHPEAHMTPGVEVTTGPLGQGIANAVGLAIGEAHLAATYNKPDFPIFNNYTYVFCGDGCLQEGISGEASSLAGHLGLNKLIVVYDDNQVTIDGSTSLSFSEDVPKRYQAYGWHTITVKDGDSDVKSIEEAFEEAKKSDKPVLISLKTTIGYGASKAGTGGVHGAPLGKDDVKKVKTKFGFDPEAHFEVSKSVYEIYRTKLDEGKKLESEWNALFKAYAEKYPKEAKEVRRRWDHKFVDGWKSVLPKYTPKSKANATRNLSQEVLNALAGNFPELVGGSADLTPSNKTNLKDFPTDFQKKTPKGRYIRFGVREHGMAAIGNGLYAYGGLIPYTATFLNFIEYAFPAVRLSALSEFQQIFIMTHDSIGLGEDGPTHQPVEALAICRATPNVLTFRPADGNETVGAYVAALENHHGPTVLALSRQDLPHLEGSTVEKSLTGGYTIKDVKDPGAILVASGSEVHTSIQAAELLKEKHGLAVKVVSMPSTELFDKQSTSYRRSVINPGVPTISVEALASYGWNKYSHFQIGLTTFGASGPYEALWDHFGFTPEKIAKSTVKYLTTLTAQTKELGTGIFPLPTHFQAAL